MQIFFVLFAEKNVLLKKTIKKTIAVIKKYSAKSGTRVKINAKRQKNIAKIFIPRFILDF